MAYITIWNDLSICEIQISARVAPPANTTYSSSHIHFKTEQLIFEITKSQNFVQLLKKATHQIEPQCHFNP